MSSELAGSDPSSSTRLQLSLLRGMAERASHDLDLEEREYRVQLSEVLGTINEGEIAAQLEARIEILEQQVERLGARRDELERGVEAELALTRAKIDELLAAVSGIDEDHGRALAGWAETLRHELRESLAGLDEEFRRLHGSPRDAIARMQRELEEHLQVRRQDFESAIHRSEASLRDEMVRLRETAAARIEEVMRAVNELRAMTLEQVLSVRAKSDGTAALLEGLLAGQAAGPRAGVSGVS